MTVANRATEIQQATRGANVWRATWPVKQLVRHAYHAFRLDMCVSREMSLSPKPIAKKPPFGNFFVLSR